MSKIEYFIAIVIVLVLLTVAMGIVTRSEMTKFEKLCGRKCDFWVLVSQFYRFQLFDEHDPYHKAALGIVFGMFPYFLLAFGVAVVSLLVFFGISQN